MDFKKIFLSAIEHNQPLTVLQLLDKGIDINLDLDGHGTTPLIAASTLNSLQIVRILHEKGANLNCRNVINDNALTAAIKSYNEQIASYLVEAGSDLDLLDITRQTPLMLALHANMPKLCKLLIMKGADFKRLDMFQNTTLFIACKFNLVEVGKILIEKGVDMNQQNAIGVYPLSCAIQSENIEFAEMLIKKGARLDKIDATDNTPINLAIIHNQEYIVDLLIAHNACMCHGTLEKAIEFGQPSIAQKIKAAILQKFSNEFYQTSSDSICSQIKRSLEEREMFIFKSFYVLLFESLDERDAEKDKERANPILSYLAGFEFQEKFVQDVMNSLREHIETLTIAEAKLERNYSSFIRKLSSKFDLKLEKDGFAKLLPLLSGNGLCDQIEAACNKKEKFKKVANLYITILVYKQNAMYNLQLATKIFSSIEQVCKQFNFSSD